MKKHSEKKHHEHEHNSPKHQVQHENISDKKIEKALIDNFVALQKVLTNLAVKFDNLSDKISSLLELFEISAKAIAEKNFEIKEGAGKETLEKLDKLLEQNRTIARGLTLMHEKVFREDEISVPQAQPQNQPQNQMPRVPAPSQFQNPQTLQQFQQINPGFQQKGNVQDITSGEYQKSITSMEGNSQPQRKQQPY